MCNDSLSKLPTDSVRGKTHSYMNGDNDHTERARLQFRLSSQVTPVAFIIQRLFETQLNL